MMLADIRTVDLKAEMERREAEMRQSCKHFTKDDGEIVEFQYLDNGTFAMNMYDDEDEFASESEDAVYYFAMEDLPKLISTARAFQNVVRA